MKVLFKRLLKTVAVLILLAIFVGGISYSVYDKSLPNGITGAADCLANNIFKVINKETYLDCRHTEWDHRGGQYRFKWDKA